ncbi:MAG: Rrf2 family transcriptional regulator [candidate division Zixibacteria bacterium]|nr:Rrf2 family transcriptional regulator [candidate division Zixibacteria bacterium]
MMLSTSEDIALKAMIYISAAAGQSRCSINEITQNELVPRVYLAKILKRLVQAGLLTSKRGVHGGYRLAKKRNEISFLSIIEAVDGPFRSMVEHDDIHDIPQNNHPASKVLGDMHKRLTDKMSKMTLNKINYKRFYPEFK